MSLREEFEAVPQLGAIEWIGVRAVHRAAMTEVTETDAIAGRGLTGDIAARATREGNRQVTLIQAEHLPLIARWTRHAEVRPEQLRRNLVVSGVNLVALARQRFQIGDGVVLLGTGPCTPCLKMDLILGAGAFQAMRGHGGITARIEQGGTIRIGDVVRSLGR